MSSELNTIRQYLQRTYQPKAILLHGSRLRGDAMPHSDWDLLLVTDNPAAITPHTYEGYTLDLTGIKPSTTIVTTGTTTLLKD
jgi:predicted nucleotidyltransferase